MDDRMNKPLDFDRNKNRPPTAKASRDERTDKNQSPSGSGNMDMADSPPGPRSGIINTGPMMGSGMTIGAGMNMGGGMNMPAGPMNMAGGMNMNPGGPMNMPGPMMNNMMGPGPMNMMNNGPNMNMMGNGMMNMSGQMNMMQPMNMAGFSGDAEFMTADPSMMGPPLEVDGKEILHFKGFILVPPPPHAPPRSTREKPPGCKTLFLGGLPETVTEDMIGELMQTCGNIETIRLGKKYFAHVRFTCYEAVDKAIFYSGWRMKIGDKDDKPNTGRIHCDYATARDDQYEYECMQRAIEREQRHHYRMLADMNRPPSPPQVARYSETEASNVTEMLKSPEGFSEAASILCSWLDKGNVTNRNANRFYTMIHSVNSTVRRLTGEKENFEQELLNYKAQYKTRVTGLLTQMDQIQNVFVKARQQKVWDHFSKPQRKNIDLWITQCQELKQKHNDELMADREEDEMDLSDSEDRAPANKKARISTGQMNTLKDENDSLKCQLEAYKNEVDMNKQESAVELERKNKQITMLQQTLKGMQEQLMATRNEVTQLQTKIEMSKGSKVEGETADNTESEAKAAEDCTTTDTTAESDTPTKSVSNASVTPARSTSEGGKMSEQDARLLGLIVCFLHVHPFGASMDYIWSYLQRGGLETKSSQLEQLLESFPNMFAQKMVGVGVNFEKRWTFIGFPEGKQT